MIPNRAFWSQQRVLVTGHTGFKGTWLSLWLERLGAQTVGLALEPTTDPNLFNLTRPLLRSCIADIRDLNAVAAVVADARPTIAIHMAAQPLVRYSYRQPIETLQTNVLGTAHLLEALRGAADLRTVLVITTDKVYANGNSEQAFKEEDRLGGHDPYSASKAAAELVTASYAQSFFTGSNVQVATARAGNVVGGGDWAEGRLIPDIWRAEAARVPVTLRIPEATRPWQHVLDLLSGYLTYAERLTTDGRALPRTLNFGPAQGDTLTVAEVTEAALAAFGSGQGWQLATGKQPQEMQFLSLDASLARETLGWKPMLPGREAIAWAVEWYKAFNKGADARMLCSEQIVRHEACL